MKIEIYTQSHCPFCKAAIELLDSRGVTYVHHLMDGQATELDEAKRKHNHNTIPIVVIDDALIGGYQELLKLDADGGLEAQ